MQVKDKQYTEHRIMVNGLNIHYIDWGNPHLPHMFLAHGAVANAIYWDLVAPALCDAGLDPVGRVGDTQPPGVGVPVDAGAKGWLRGIVEHGDLSLESADYEDSSSPLRCIESRSV